MELKPKHREQLSQSFAVDHNRVRYEWSIQSKGMDQTLIFHQAVGLKIGTDWAETPCVSERVLRGRLLIEEVEETLHAMGLRLFIENGNLDVEHVEGLCYCPIETADGLADIKVIANGTAVSFGIPLGLVEREVFASNMSKLDENGKPIVNRCIDDSCYEMAAKGDCTDVNHLVDPTKPVGKVLKPDTYVPANIARLFVEYTKQGE